MTKDDLLSFVDEVPDKAHSARPQHSKVPWQVLIVDDDHFVHNSTKLALRDIQLEGRPLEFLSVYSAAEAKDFLRSHGNQIAVILLDVVMETEDAGLVLVSTIRNELKLAMVRIILRTGQPGYAPELATIQNLDINDYKNKAELSRNGLISSLTVALRSYSQLQQLEQSRRGLEKIVQGSCDLSRIRGLSAYAEGAVLQICSLLGVSAEGLVCVQGMNEGQSEAHIIAAAGKYASLINQPLSALPSNQMQQALQLCLQKRNSQFSELTTLYFKLDEQRAVATCVLSDRVLSELDQQLLKAFCGSITIGFDNVVIHEKLEAEAFVDPLLGIPNRNGFEKLIIRQQERFQNALLLLIDIDDFSAINATLDQHYGDDVLRAVCQRIQLLVGDATLVGRVSGDCFALIGPLSVTDCNAIVQALQEPLLINASPLTISVTCGVVKLTEHEKSSCATELLKDANIALKQAKLFNRGSMQYFDVNLRLAAEARISLLGGLREAFSAKHLFLHYQPQICLKTGRVIGAEALLRWKTQKGEFIPPDQFIPLAEQSGIIVPIGSWVLQTACNDARQLLNSGYDDFRVAVNVSHAQLRETGFVAELERALRLTGLPGKNLELELTESIAIEDIAFINQLLNKIHQLDVSIALDDFGTGYSSLNLLHQLKIQRLKVDRSFVSKLLSNSKESKLAQVMVHLAQDFELKTIAEGIETEAQSLQLKAMGCEEGQGYFFAKPMDFATLQQWMAAYVPS